MELLKPYLKGLVCQKKILFISLDISLCRTAERVCGMEIREHYIKVFCRMGFKLKFILSQVTMRYPIVETEIS